MKTLLKVENLSVEAKSKKSSIKLVDNISFSLKEGECLGILGESGSGKSMTCKAIMGLLDKNFQIKGSAIYENSDLLQKNNEDMRKLRGKEIAMVLQNPMTCFDPLYSIGYQMAETFTEHLNLKKVEIKNKFIEILELMQVKNAEEILHK